VHQSVGCQLQAVPHYRRSVKKLMGLVTQNGDFDFKSILEKITILILILKIVTALANLKFEVDLFICVCILYEQMSVVAF